jgi:hypothetical protein
MTTKTANKIKRTLRSTARGQSFQDLLEEVRRLRTPQREKLRKTLDELDEEKWQRGRNAAARRMAQKGITDEDIDQIVIRNRREGRR